MAKLVHNAKVDFSALSSGEAVMYKRFTADKTFVPFAWAVKRLNITPPHTLLKEPSPVFPPKSHQITALRETASCLITRGHCMVKCPPGFGKTFMALTVWRALDVPAVVLTNRKVLVKQWHDSALKFYPDSCVKSGLPDKTASPAHIYVANPVALKSKRYSSRDAPAKFLLVVDEAHQLVSPVALRVLLSIRPTFLLGLSATPMRYDDFHAAIALFFGSDESLVGRDTEKVHSVEIVETGIKMPIVIDKRTGKLDWNAVVEKQASDPLRLNLTVSILAERLDVKWLVLCKRVKHVKALAEALKKWGATDTLHGAKNEWDENAWCVVGTYSKIGTGFDACERTGLCLAADIDRYFEQCLGRLRCCGGLVMDLVDDMHVLRKHAERREAVYETNGCQIKRRLPC
ncbi:helicase-like protein [Largemouth bass virus]|uniref:Helicase-like protein n=1 Tax=Largemouth bass virus TaxID=176656 RepID=A0A9E7PRA8_9VIRU|nr:putative helicase-like protein [Mandarin fish ranavirus]UUY86230.1 helicase-like protein [Largemouth bass virus]WEI28970.1 helicase-like protein [Largemouth bass virus]WHA35536.1 putative helicase-like protein [Micropterus salmoides ranavirus]WHA35641.1 putative helicase-like protein [Siniperca chuatsi ranavirus]